MNRHIVNIVKQLYDKNMILFASSKENYFTLKNGSKSPIYINLRNISSHRHLLYTICKQVYVHFLCSTSKDIVLCGVPYGGIHYATYLSFTYGFNYLMKRKEQKKHGLKNDIDGEYTENTQCILIEDVITTGSSVLQTITQMEQKGINIIKIIVIVCRDPLALETIRGKGYQIEVLFTLEDILSVCQNRNLHNKKLPTFTENKYQNRLELLHNQLAKNIYRQMFLKKTNIALSLDVEDKTLFLDILEKTAPHICMLKTHIDIIEHFDDEFILSIQRIQEKHPFYILEDRKFSDIGNTVKKQITGGIYHINRWADSITAHGIAGDGIIDIYSEINKNNKNKGIIFVSEMSSSGNLISKSYTDTISKMCLEKPEYITGFVCQKKTMVDHQFLYFTPGVSISTTSKDHMDQNYRTPEVAIMKDHCDIMIIGRTIYQSEDPLEMVVQLKKQCWKLYTQEKNK
tara:strand:+ start:1173 stop:2546 length:1374 start_codon:yes stop_codon:yes gene_type:complete